MLKNVEPIVYRSMTPSHVSLGAWNPVEYWAPDERLLLYERMDSNTDGVSLFSIYLFINTIEIV